MSIYSNVNFEDGMDSNENDQYYVALEYNQLNQGKNIDIWVHVLDSDINLADMWKYSNIKNLFHTP